MESKLEIFIDPATKTDVTVLVLLKVNKENLFIQD